MIATNNQNISSSLVTFPEANFTESSSKERTWTNVKLFFQNKGPLYWEGKVQAVAILVALIFAGFATALLVLSLWGSLAIGPAVCSSAVFSFVGGCICELAKDEERGKYRDSHHALSLRTIDKRSLAELTKIHPGEYRSLSYREAYWWEIFDFYSSVLTPEQLIERIRTENARIKLKDIFRICREVQPRYAKAFAPELQRQFAMTIEDLTCKQISQELTYYPPKTISLFQKWGVISSQQADCFFKMYQASNWMNSRTYSCTDVFSLDKEIDPQIFIDKAEYKKQLEQINTEYNLYR